jgi:uncharacterized protein YpmB
VTDVFAWIVGVALAVIVPTVVVLVVQERVRRQRSRAAARARAEAVAVCADIARLRALAAADGAEAAFVTPGTPRADAFLAVMFPRTKGAPKERP